MVVAGASLLFAGSGTAAPPPPVTNYQVVTATFTAVNLNEVTLDANCPTGKHALGGGGEITAFGSFTYAGDFDLIGTAPMSGQTGWRARWHSTSQANATFTATALCANTA